jgi:hypothetical protein
MTFYINPWHSPPKNPKLRENPQTYLVNTYYVPSGYWQYLGRKPRHSTLVYEMEHRVQWERQIKLNNPTKEGIITD